MLAKFRNLLARSSATKPRSVPAGERVYAIGDIHGRIDLFENLIRLIEDDDAARRPARTTVVLLGDLVDRGPDSAAVVARARDWGRTRKIEYIQGNHEEMLLSSRSKIDALRGFVQFGGCETIQSYGVDAEAIFAADFEELQALMNAAIPQDDVDFLSSFQKMVRIGDYLFVHAGIHPDTPVEDQTGRDCRWIREPFLSYKGDFGACIIHGHTITEQPDVRHNRIGIDTGAFLHGTLTAIGLEGTDRWFLQAHHDAAAGEASVAA
ncbi:metallophosphoesterase [Novosphingobium album (ex Hu et al. 2023)]|uniref:Metallophosphoesterase n=1 Tax=Novosphingobium album (ex Hu et al. 2023) TaxID=2930093 RepID=A0ABT0AWT7_9SPHN|nr:metallophosphoesterase [Novosphingobium album (ex Hu et al. 2023)]MCJ2177274.1 metallophosphoesterase [Novosphingobium album (ex Hu et al. 2023)]